MTTQLSRYRGCLLGLAAGDALGAPVEFMSWGAIRARFGEGGIRDFVPGPCGVGRITDDTQMTVATAQGLLRAGGHASDAGTGSVLARSGQATPLPPSTVNRIHQAYLDWLRTQSDPAQRRGPGNTCLSALGSGRMGTMEHPINNSKGCGGVMRVAPVGLAYPAHPSPAFELGAASAAITHGHPGGYLPSGFLAALIASIVTGGRVGAGAPSLDGVVAAMLAGSEGARLDQDTSRLVHQAVDLARAGAGPEGAFPTLGEGWTGDEALAIALFCALRYPDSLENTVVAAVNHSGDSDSTGSIAGGILGAYLGEEAIPRRWLRELENRAELEQLAEEMYHRFAGRQG